ncbi:MAG: PqqD family protein [Oscillospiraceae bacterium]|nr:PqqD family protein [Oscillospiraceae bacterium]
MHLIKDHILRKVHRNTVLVPPPDRDIGFNGMIVLNHTGEFVCKMLREDTDRDKLAAALAQEYEVDPKQAEADLDVFLSELGSCNMLEE